MNLNDSALVLLLLSTFRLSLPLMLTATGGYFSEKSGISQIGLESFLLIGAFSAASATFFTGSLAAGYLIAAIMTALFSQIFNVLVLRFKASSVIIGTAMNLLAIGLIPLMSKSFFDSTGSTPSLAVSSSGTFPFVILITTLLVCYYLSEKTLWGLQVKFAGEKREALEAVGVSVVRRQWQAITLCAFVTGLGGAMLSTYLSSSYSPLMSAGRGYIALAAIIFAGWHLQKAVLISLFFGFFEALQIQAQSNALISTRIPAEFIQMTPYLMTLLALLFFKTKQQAPKELR